MLIKLDQVHCQILKRSNKTSFYGSYLFPSQVRRDVLILYGFVRTADDFVDSIPQQRDKFYYFRDEYQEALHGGCTDNVIIKYFIDLLHRKDFDVQWVDAFLYSMELDLTKRVYKTLEETLQYIYGCAEVIGLFLAKIMGISPDSYHSARMLGRAIEYVHLMRDIAYDWQLGRVYLPLEESELDNLSYEYVSAKSELFIKFIQVQIERYKVWQAEAEKGFVFIPSRYLIPIKTGSDIYKWTARKIEKNPFIVYQEKVKPSRAWIFSQVLLNTLTIGVVESHQFHQ